MYIILCTQYMHSLVTEAILHPSAKACQLGCPKIILDRVRNYVCAQPFHTCPLLIWIQSSFNPASKSKPDLIYFISSANTTETRLDPESI